MAKVTALGKHEEETMPGPVSDSYGGPAGPLWDKARKSMEDFVDSGRLNGPDLLLGKNVFEAVLANAHKQFGLPPLDSVSINVDPYLEPNAIVGCTEVGHQIVKDMKKRKKGGDNVL